MKKLSFGIALFSLFLLGAATSQNAYAQENEGSANVVEKRLEAVETKEVVAHVPGRDKWTFKHINIGLNKDHGLFISPLLPDEQFKKMRNYLTNQTRKFTINDFEVLNSEGQKKKINLSVKIVNGIDPQEFTLKIKSGSKWTRAELYKQLEATLGYSLYSYSINMVEKMDYTEKNQLKNFTFEELTVKTKDNKFKVIDLKVTVEEEK